MDERSKDEAERIRDDALRRALTTPPKPHKPKSGDDKKPAKKAGSKRGDRDE